MTFQKLSCFLILNVGIVRDLEICLKVNKAFSGFYSRHPLTLPNLNKEKNYQNLSNIPILRLYLPYILFQVKIPLCQVDLAQTINEWKDVQSCKEDDEYLGDICFSLRYIRAKHLSN